jgi:hypothetical protein
MKPLRKLSSVLETIKLLVLMDSLLFSSNSLGILWELISIRQSRISFPLGGF